MKNSLSLDELPEIEMLMVPARIRMLVDDEMFTLNAIAQDYGFEDYEDYHLSYGDENE
jgi:hypothetical protein